MKRSSSLIILFVLLITAPFFAQRKEITVEAIYGSRAFSGNTLRGVQWFAGGSKYSFLKYDQQSGSMAIFQHDCKTGEESVLINADILGVSADDKSYSIQNYQWSPDESKILFTGVLPARTLKTGGAFYIYDLKAKKFFLLAGSEAEQSNAQFSPDGKKLGFVRGNDLYVIDIASKKETRLTSDGSENILNGKFDWVYEEEFSVIDGWVWSPDSRSVAFWRLDQSAVPEVSITLYDSLYMNALKYHYPKPGGKNSVVKIGVADITSGKTAWMDTGSETDIYIPRIKFTADPNLLAVQRLNRLQNKLDLLFCDARTGSSTAVIEERDSAWIDISDDLTFLKDGRRFIWSSDKDGFNHLYLYDYSGKLINQITKGKWEISQINSVDEKSGTVYYTSNERGRLYKDLYSISLSGKNKKLLTQEKGSHSVNISTGNEYFIDKYSNTGTLPSTILYKNDGSKVTSIITADMKQLSSYGLSPVEFFRISASDGFEMDAYMIRPPDFDENKKYPVIIMGYNGPGSQYISDSWTTAGGWEQMMAQKGYIIVGIDTRITAGNGNVHKKYAYKNLGYWEISDLSDAARYLGSLRYVDKNRLGIWGWSYGGYVSALAILKASEFFKAAIAVAPVTHWKFYDSIYTERYMSIPALNPKGYEESAPLNYADQLKGKLLLIHGMADDNVHFQNSAELVNELISAEKQFSVMYYPGRDHSIYGGNTRVQLYHLMTDFFLNNL